MTSRLNRTGISEEIEAGKLLDDLERRQDDVLSQLDQLDLQLSTILRGLGVTTIEDVDIPASDLRVFRCEEEDEDDAAEVFSEGATEAATERAPIARRWAA